MDCRWSGEIHRRFHQDGKLACAPHSNRVRAKLRTGNDSRCFDLYRLRLVGDSLMEMFRQHILSIVVFWPLAGMVVLFFFNKENKSLIKWWTNFVAVVGFLISIPLWFWFDFANG